MGNGWNTLFMSVLAILAYFTGEIVTFFMLGIILISLNNINTTLKKIYHVQKLNASAQQADKES
ncbi:hypothetical protein [Bacillus solimangrovi]|uniref:Uncharacterized protein n=1 Tax=Bacillus solimangrovi TaxID=1305675 RepID=A0A1E5LAK1_9BACI|nr:hypothetical protein [Bacillus solimangrovi]OEH91118.1 hypothetical protein BFG57_07030 [Bacillus solimangrovi]